jgi:dipeptide/tripeptide permease
MMGQNEKSTALDYAATESPQTPTWRFPACFWVANVAELFERAAFYGTFIVLTLYLSQKVGFTDVGAGSVAAVFSFLLYMLPIFLGPLSDKLGFRAALILAFALLACGYGLLGALTLKVTAVIALLLVAAGGAIVKPVISGTAAKCSTSINRARAFSIFYMMVNIGAFSGKTIAPYLRQGFHFGRWEFKLGLEYINFYSAVMAALALVLIAVAYRSPDDSGQGKTFGEIWDGFCRVIANGRFMCLILIIAGFWMIQGQLYASMPKYIIRLIGPSAKPEWLANVNPLMVVLCVVPITQLVKNLRPERSIMIAMALIPMSALLISLSPVLQRWTGNSVTLFGSLALHPLTVMAILGIAVQGLAECFLAPKFMEYASKQAPRGEEGLYMGFQNLPTAISWFVGFIASGYLLNAFCPDPEILRKTDPGQYAQLQSALAGHSALPPAYARAQYLWYFFVGVGVAAFIALLVFNKITAKRDAELRNGAAF